MNLRLFFSEILSDFLNCVPKVVGSSATPVRIAKLKCFKKIAKSDLFNDPGMSICCRSFLFSNSLNDQNECIINGKSKGRKIILASTTRPFQGTVDSNTRILKFCC